MGQLDYGKSIDLTLKSGDKNVNPTRTYELFKFKVSEKPGQAAFEAPLYQLVTMDFSNGTFRVHDVQSGNQLYRLEGFGSADSIVTYYNQAISGMGGGQILLWDLENRIYMDQIGNHGPWVSVTALDITDSGPSLISGDENGSVRYWNLGSGVTKTLGKHTSIVDCAAISPDGRIAASGSLDGTIRIWNCNYCKQIDTIDIGYRTLGLDFSKDGNCLLIVSGSVTRRHLHTNEVIWSHHETEGVYYYGSFTQNDAFVLCGGPSLLSLLDADTGEKLVAFEGQTGTVIAMDFSPDGQHVYSASNDGTVRIWRLPF